MKKLHRFTGALFVVLLAAMSTGCVQLSAIPNVAHSGDSVVLGVGGINRNWGGDKPRNLQVSITDSAGHTFPLTASVVFQAYPDYRAGSNILALQGNDGLQLQPYDGAWFLTVSLTQSGGAPLALALGAATVHVAADNLTVVRDGNGALYADEGDPSNIPLTIIAGPPNADNSTMQYGAYDNRGSHFLIRPAAASDALIGGAYYVVHYQSDAQFGPLKPIVFPVSHNPFVKMDYKLQANGDGSGTYYIYIYDPSGFTATSPRDARQAALPDLGVHLEYYEVGVGAWAKSNFSFDADNSYFVDIDGDRITDLHAEMLHADDL